MNTFNFFKILTLPFFASWALGMEQLITENIRSKNFNSPLAIPETSKKQYPRKLFRNHLEALTKTYVDSPLNSTEILPGVWATLQISPYELATLIRILENPNNPNKEPVLQINDKIRIHPKITAHFLDIQRLEKAYHSTEGILCRYQLFFNDVALNVSKDQSNPLTVLVGIKRIESAKLQRVRKGHDDARDRDLYLSGIKTPPLNFQPATLTTKKRTHTSSHKRTNALNFGELNLDLGNNNLPTDMITETKNARGISIPSAHRRGVALDFIKEGEKRK